MKITSFLGSTGPLSAAQWAPKKDVDVITAIGETHTSLLEGFFKQVCFNFLLEGLIILTGFDVRREAVPQRRCHEAEGSTSV